MARKNLYVFNTDTIFPLSTFRLWLVGFTLRAGRHGGPTVIVSVTVPHPSGLPQTIVFALSASSGFLVSSLFLKPQSENLTVLHHFSIHLPLSLLLYYLLFQKVPFLTMPSSSLPLIFVFIIRYVLLYWFSPTVLWHEGAYLWVASHEALTDTALLSFWIWKALIFQHYLADIADRKPGGHTLFLWSLWRGGSTTICLWLESVSWLLLSELVFLPSGPENPPGIWSSLDVPQATQLVCLLKCMMSLFSSQSNFPLKTMSGDLGISFPS